MKVLLSQTDNTDMYRRAFARHRTLAALLLGLSLRAPSASAEHAEPDATRVGTVQGQAAEEVPSAAETPSDLLRAEEALPRVTPVDSGLPFHVRGAPPRDASYFLDRVHVPYLYHIGQDPSVIHPGSIDRVDLYLGGDPARFGRFAGLELAPSGEVSSRLFDLGALIEPTFARGRVSLLPALLSCLIPQVKLDNRDYQPRATHEPSARDRFSAFGFGPYDLLGEKRNGVLTRLGDAFKPKITFTW
jgi:hypothetical protein